MASIDKIRTPHTGAAALYDARQLELRSAVASITHPTIVHAALGQFDRAWNRMLAMRSTKDAAGQIAQKDPILKKIFSGNSWEKSEKLKRLFSTRAPYDEAIFYAVKILLGMDSLRTPTPEYGRSSSLQLLRHLYFNTTIKIFRFSCHGTFREEYFEESFIAISRIAEKIFILRYDNFAYITSVSIKVYKLELEKTFEKVCCFSPELGGSVESVSLCARQFLEFTAAIDQEVPCCLKALRTTSLIPPLQSIALGYVGIEHGEPVLSAVPELETLS